MLEVDPKLMSDYFPPIHLYILTAISATILTKIDAIGNFRRAIVVCTFGTCCIHMIYTIQQFSNAKMPPEVVSVLDVHLWLSVALFVTFVFCSVKRKTV